MGNPNHSAIIDGIKIAAKTAVKSQLKTTATKEFLKTSAGKAVAKETTHLLRSVVNTACKSQAGKTVVAKTASGIAMKSVAGAASRSVTTCAMKGNVIGAGIGLAINSAGDVIDLCRGKQTGKQFAKNMAKNTAETGDGLSDSGIGADIGAFAGVDHVLSAFSKNSYKQVMDADNAHEEPSKHQKV